MAQSRSPAEAPYPGIQRSEATGWVAWALFGGVMLVLVGALHAALGMVALTRPEALAGTRADLLLPVGLTGLAWMHVLGGIAQLLVGVGLVRGLRWARVGAVALGTLSALVNFAFLDIYPVWSVAALALSLIVIYAAAAHGAEVADAYGTG
jgi:hypothetical protein